MSAPTINEMLAWLDDAWVYGEVTGKVRVMVGAIRAILEQYEKSGSRVIYDYHPNELEAIRAFVERVEKNAYVLYEDWPSRLYEVIHKELEEMEKENNAETKTPNEANES